MANRAQETTAEVPGSHAVYVSNPGAVAKLIEQAAAGGAQAFCHGITATGEQPPAGMALKKI